MAAVELPCRIGDTVWVLEEYPPYRVNKYKVQGFKVTAKMKVLPLVAYDIPVRLGEDGFLEERKAREEAERRKRQVK